MCTTLVVEVVALPGGGVTAGAFCGCADGAIGAVTGSALLVAATSFPGRPCVDPPWSEVRPTIASTLAATAHRARVMRPRDPAAGGDSVSCVSISFLPWVIGRERP